MPLSRPHPAQERVPVLALLLGERLDARALERKNARAPPPLTIPAGRQGYGVLFRYGLVVLFNLTPFEEAQFLASLAPLMTARLAAPAPRSRAWWACMLATLTLACWDR